MNNRLALLVALLLASGCTPSANERRVHATRAEPRYVGTIATDGTLTVTETRLGIAYVFHASRANDKEPFWSRQEVRGGFVVTYLPTGQSWSIYPGSLNDTEREFYAR